MVDFLVSFDFIFEKNPADVSDDFLFDDES
jgi:hypothetical protein